MDLFLRFDSFGLTRVFFLRYRLTTRFLTIRLVLLERERRKE